MKTFIVIICLLSVSWSFAQTQKDRIKPTKCLYTSGVGKKGSTGATQRSELCSVMNPKGGKRIAGVCVFDKVWKRGTWDPSKKGRDRFIVYRVCDQGVEYSSSPEESLPFGPQLWNPDLVRIEKTVHTSNLQGSDYRIQGKVPATCFTQNDPSTFAAANGKTCVPDILSNGYCELKNLSNFSSSGKKLNGLWWVQYSNVAQRTFSVCVGGVTLVAPSPDDDVYERVSNVSPVPAGEAKICIRREGAVLKEIVCKPGNVAGNCYRGANNQIRNNWKNTVFNYVKNKYSSAKTFHATRRNDQLQVSGLTFEQVQKWTPTVEADIEFLNGENEKLETDRWVQIKTLGTDIVDCEEVIQAKPKS